MVQSVQARVRCRLLKADGSEEGVCKVGSNGWCSGKGPTAGGAAG